jgi:hypothetical protein
MTTTDRKDMRAGTASEDVARTRGEDVAKTAVSRLTSEQVWAEVARASFAVLGYSTPSGEPRSSGVVYKTVGGRLYVAVAPNGWKARHIAMSGRVAVTVPVRRGGGLFVAHRADPARNGQLLRVCDRPPVWLATG